MDISKFSSDNFDAKAWINDVFSHVDSNTDREHFATGLVTKLQVFIQEVAKSLEDINGQIIQAVPKVMREFDAMQQEAVLLQGKMKAVQSDVRKIENETVAAMDTLLTIDSAKSRMKEVERALKEVDNWTTLTKDINEVFSSGNPDLIVNKLIGMQQCLTVLGPKIRDHKERSDYLEQLKDQFISIISPSVVAAFASQSLESAQYFAKVFGELARMDDLEKYYRKSLKADVAQHWMELVQSDEMQDAADLMNSFYDYLLSLWFSQLKWYGQVLKTPGPVICRGFMEALSSLDPSIDKVIMNRLDTYPNRVAAILTAKLASDNFARSMESSLSNIDALHSTDAYTLLQEIFKPFVPFVLHYQQYEQSQLLMNLDQCEGAEGGWSSLSKIQKSVNPVFSEAFEGLERCGTLSDGFALPFLVKAYRTYFTNYVAILKKFLDSIQISKDEMGLENWDRVQNVLILSQLCGEMILNLRKLDEAVDVAGEKLLYKTRSLQESMADGITDISFAYDVVLFNDPTLRSAVEQFSDKFSDAKTTKLRVLSDIGKQLRVINNRVHQLAADLILEPIRQSLNTLAKFPVWSASSIGEALTADLPSFSVAPLEYVTKVGQYLINLAHYLEPYLNQENAAICTALAECRLPFVQSQPDTLNSEQAGRLWLECAARGIMISYGDAVSGIRQLSPSGCKQLLVDVEYLCNVIDDMGLTVDDSIKALAKLLKMSPEELSDKSVTTGLPERYVSLVKEAKGLKS